VSEQPWPQEIQDAEFLRLTTFRRSGVGVATPVWFVVDGNALLVTTMDSTGKAKRLRNNPRVTLAVCDRRGRVGGPEFDATAELVRGQAGTDIRRRVMKRYGFGGWILLTLAHVVGLARNRTGQRSVGIRLVRSDASV
jgi:PPOX class probable F420-dependent enzyme